MRALYTAFLCVACSGGSAAPDARGTTRDATGGAPGAAHGGADERAGAAAVGSSGARSAAGGSTALGSPSGASGNAGLGNAEQAGDSAVRAGETSASGASGVAGATSSAGGHALTFAGGRVVVTGVRGTSTPAAESVILLHNGGQAAAQVTSLALGGPNQVLFELVNPPALPITLAAGADLALRVQMTTSGSLLPARLPEPKIIGTVVLDATLMAMVGADTVTAGVYGLVLDVENYEPTLGQILSVLGYRLNVGQAQNNWNPNTSMNGSNLPGVEAGTDEVAASRFIKAGPGPVTFSLVARFSPVGELPYGWYGSTSGCPTGCTTVGTMAMSDDAQTSDMARMVNPPLAAGSSSAFDPGAKSFGIWVDSDQKTQRFNEGGNSVNGDWDYSEDALNAPAFVHRFKSYPLKDADGVVPKSYLIAVEEAGNGDYQDYVFVLGNVTPVP